MHATCKISLGNHRRSRPIADPSVPRRSLERGQNSPVPSPEAASGHVTQRRVLYALVVLSATLAAACSDARTTTAPLASAATRHSLSAPRTSSEDEDEDGLAADDPGAVYALTNSAQANAVAVFRRDANGSLDPAGTVPTGGRGNGQQLGSQGALAGGSRRRLFAVNAGSNSVSVLQVTSDGLRLVETAPSGGTKPISLTVHGDLLYVLNAGGRGNIAGFRIGEGGELRAIAGSRRPLSTSAAGPAEAHFSPDGDLLVVTEKATNTIDTYRVRDDGVADGPVAHPSAGMTPFGFTFDRRGHLLVSEAFGGTPGQSAVSSYRLSTVALSARLVDRWQRRRPPPAGLS